ncbi:MAG: aspartyl/glutamyl-tRNA amidotransferase subunit A [Spirochaetaceae bacterium]|jgi:aspartyl-tRNA(Asn)/glutamyl-tRNA(Gln) amidotransferase subunit A|nr:aspartyl/glutamyl-tRNA amidotransferase subunit A [Spirochaetaceae bacterium]
MLSYFNKWEEKIGAFIEIHREALSAPPLSTGGLAGLPFAVKDNIAVKGFSLTCGSKLLQNFRSPYTATAVRNLEAAGAYVIGKTNLDEFGMGSSTDNSALKRTNNPWDSARVAGGSSGGSAAAVAAGLVPFALGSDTGGSVRQPAAFCGIIGLKPTYGAVSRYGLVAYASSLETIGVLADGVDRCRQVFTTIRGPDPADQTSYALPPPSEPSRIIGVLSAESIARSLSNEGGVLEEAGNAVLLEEDVRHGFDRAKAILSDLGYKLIELSIPSLKYGVPAYYTIATAEASANLARFDSIRYGQRPLKAENPDTLLDAARTGGFGDEVRLRILLGTFVLRSGFQDRYYLRAQRIRAQIRQDFEQALTQCDAILMPVFPTRAFSRGENTLSPFVQKAADLYTCCANLAGLPALSFPASVEGGLPVGVQLLASAGAEETVFAIAEDYEKIQPLPHPCGWKSLWHKGS